METEHCRAKVSVFENQYLSLSLLIVSMMRKNNKQSRISSVS